jgi:Ser/Thr protein kinase RdoA (MazF antagonist)
MSKLGSVIADLHRSAQGFPVIHRRYWDAEGLVGARPKFGSIDRLEGISTKAQDTLSQGRLLILCQLKRFEGAFPQKQGLIHADLHFDNVLVSQGDLAVIDFDDCGFGFHAYDLAVNLGSVRHSLPNGRKREFPKLKQALIEAYAFERGWSKSDEQILPCLMTARSRAMLGWLNSRSDHPVLRKRVKVAVTRTVKHLHKEYGL